MSRSSFRSCRSQMLSKTGVLRNFTKITGKLLCRGPFVNKVTGFCTGNFSGRLILYFQNSLFTFTLVTQKRQFERILNLSLVEHIKMPEKCGREIFINFWSSKHRNQFHEKSFQFKSLQFLKKNTQYLFLVEVFIKIFLRQDALQRYFRIYLRSKCPQKRLFAYEILYQY